MKQIFGLLTIICVFSYVSCESCTVNGDCTTTTCTGATEVICEHPEGDGVTTNGGLCTCADSDVECTARSDCFGSGAPNLNCGDNQRHCYDNSCICGLFPGGK